MLQSVKRAHAIDPNHPHLHEHLIKLAVKGWLISLGLLSFLLCCYFDLQELPATRNRSGAGGKILQSASKVVNVLMSKTRAISFIIKFCLNAVNPPSPQSMLL